MSNIFDDDLVGFKGADPVRPMLNVGFLQDIQTGKYVFGQHGESILVGGLPYFEGYAGLPNMYKTGVSVFKQSKAMKNYPCAKQLVYDTESTFDRTRYQRAYKKLEINVDVFDKYEKRFKLSDTKVYPTGNDYFEALKSISKKRSKIQEEHLYTTPFWDAQDKQNLKSLPPILNFVDSLSTLQSDVVQEMYDSNEIGESGLNMSYMKGSGAKSQLVDQMTGICSSGTIYTIMTAHIGEKYSLNQYKPELRKLRLLKDNLKLKKVPENFLFLTANCWHCSGYDHLLDSNKMPQYPVDENDNKEKDTDLIELELTNLRGKSGSSGIPFSIIISQTEGVLEELTQFHFCKNTGYFGITGKQTFHLDLYPDVKLTRKSVRSALSSNQLLKAAMHFTCELAEMMVFWRYESNPIFCFPCDLYKDLKEMGYDWNLLLSTRAYWTYEEDNNQIPFLSTMDLLRMRAGLYVPYWYPDKDSIQLNKAINIDDY